MNNLKIIAFTHKNTSFADLSKFFIEESARKTVLEGIKKNTQSTEIMYLATCNRIEFIFSSDEKDERAFILQLLSSLPSAFTHLESEAFFFQAEIYNGHQALEHLFRVSSSLESLVVGEREIITQVRKSYEECNKLGVSGDLIRLCVQHAIRTAKEIYTHTKIAEKSVSVVFLAYQRLRDLAVKLDAKILFVGAGQTNQTMAKFLRSHGFSNFSVFNRSMDNSTKLANDLGGKAYNLAQLEEYTGGFDVLISCTGAAHNMISAALYQKLLMGDSQKKVLVDLAIPYDIDRNIPAHFPTHLIGIEDLQATAEANKQEREREIGAAEKIVADNLQVFESLLKHRQVELALKEVPKKVSEIRQAAIGSVFAKELQGMDAATMDILNRVLNYMEKKYIAMPMVIAKDILIPETKKQS